MISAILLVKISLCVHYVMKGVTSGTIEILVRLHMYCSYLIMVAQFSLLPSWHFGVSIHFISILFSLWCDWLAVLFLEFWKRRQFVLQHDWDVLGYEEVEV